MQSEYSSINDIIAIIMGNRGRGQFPQGEIHDSKVGLSFLKSFNEI